MNRSVTCGEPERFKIPLYQAMAQGDFFMLLFQPECNFTPR